jgi:hypothetical protein
VSSCKKIALTEADINMQSLGGHVIILRAPWCVECSAPAVGWHVLTTVTGCRTITSDKCVTRVVPWSFTPTDKMYALIAASIGMWFHYRCDHIADCSTFSRCIHNVCGQNLCRIFNVHIFTTATNARTRVRRAASLYAPHSIVAWFP